MTVLTHDDHEAAARLDRETVARLERLAAAGDYPALYRAVHELEEAQEQYERDRYVEVTPERLLYALETSRAPLNLDRRVDDALVYAYTVDGEPVMRARPRAPRQGEPDLRVCAVCGESLEGKRPQAKYCDKCAQTGRRVKESERQRKREARERLAEDLTEHIERMRDMARREKRQFSDRQLLAIAEVLAASTEARAKDVLARYPRGLFDPDRDTDTEPDFAWGADPDDDLAGPDGHSTDDVVWTSETEADVRQMMVNEAVGWRWPTNRPGSLGHVRRAPSRRVPNPRLRASQGPLEPEDPCFEPDVSRQLQTGYARRPVDLDFVPVKQNPDQVSK
jgi:hypothetical protein